MSNITEMNINGTIYPIGAKWENIINKPTTLSEYGITDAYIKAEIDALIETIVETYFEEALQARFTKRIYAHETHSSDYDADTNPADSYSDGGVYIDGALDPSTIYIIRVAHILVYYSALTLMAITERRKSHCMRMADLNIAIDTIQAVCGMNGKTLREIQQYLMPLCVIIKMQRLILHLIYTILRLMNFYRRQHTIVLIIHIQISQLLMVQTGIAPIQ